MFQQKHCVFFNTGKHWYMNTFDRLFIARTFLSLSQKEAAEQAGINATAISVMERGEKKFIPTEYLQYLYSKGIDINWLFSNSNDTSLAFRTIPETAPPVTQQQSNLHVALNNDNIQNSGATSKAIQQYMQDFNNDLKDILNELKKMNASLCPSYPG